MSLYSERMTILEMNRFACPRFRRSDMLWNHILVFYNFLIQ